MPAPDDEIIRLRADLNQLSQDFQCLCKAAMEQIPALQVERLGAKHLTAEELVATGSVHFPVGAEILRGALPLCLTNDQAFVDIKANSQTGERDWTTLTRTVYDVNVASFSQLPGTRRLFRLIIRSGNPLRKDLGDTCAYRLYYSYAGMPDNREYQGRTYWGSPNEGAWEVIDLDHIANPDQSHSRPDHWILQGAVSNPKPPPENKEEREKHFNRLMSRVFSVTLHVVDIMK